MPVTDTRSGSTIGLLSGLVEKTGRFIGAATRGRIGNKIPTSSQTDTLPCSSSSSGCDLELATVEIWEVASNISVISGPNYTITNITIQEKDRLEFEQWCEEQGMDTMILSSDKNGILYLFSELASDTLMHMKLRWA